MSVQKALVVTRELAPWTLVTDRAIPKPGPKDVLIKVLAAALNPADWKIQSSPNRPPMIDSYPFIGGLDGAGVVEETGPEVTNVAKGDKILFPGAFEPLRATFQQYVLAPAANVAKIPENISIEQAASVPLGLATVATGIWSHHPEAKSVNFPALWEEGGKTKFAGQAALIIGGASSVGQYAIQLARLSGFSPIFTTASPHNAAHLRALGASHVIDRKLSFDAIAAEITRLAGGQPVVYIYDAIAERATQRFAYDVLADGGALVVTYPFSHEFIADKIREGDGKKVARPFASLHIPENEALGQELYARLTEWLRTGIIVPNRIEVLPGGLLGIPEGLDRMKNGKVSGTKLIVRVQDTI